MRWQGWAGGGLIWSPAGWPAGESSSPQITNGAPSRWRRIVFGKNPSRTLRRVLLWATSTMVTFHYLLVPIKVTGASMQPTYRDGSVNFINRVSYVHNGPKRGDVVILREGEDLIIKRVIGMPGERITLDRGVFKINGKPLRDQFSNIPVNWEIDPVNLGPDDYYVIGDNRTASIFGKFKRSEILGKAVF